MTAHGTIIDKRRIDDVDDDDDDEDSTLPPPPDGGWGWIVVFASFMIHIINDGITYSFGVFYDEFLTYFDEGKGATAWILSILVGMTLCSGPISSSFVNRWGCKPVTIAGAVIATVCMVISVFAPNVTTMYFTIGVGAGLGFGLIYLPAIVSVTMYFEKRRSLATGIAVCGSGFGTFVFAPLITLLLDEYGWRGSMLIVAGIVLECIPLGALFRPLEYDERTRKCANSSEIALKSTHAQLDLPIDDQQRIHRPRSLGHIALFKSVKFENDRGKSAKANNNEVSRLALSQPMLITSTRSEGRAFGSHKGPLYRPDVFYQGSLMNLPSASAASAHRSRNDVNVAEDANNLMERRHSTYSYKRRAAGAGGGGAISSSGDEAIEGATVCGLMPCSGETRDTLREMLDFALFKDVVFVLFTVSNFLTSIGFNIPYVYIVSRAKYLGISGERAGALLSVIGIANTIGRIVLGYVSDKPWVNRLLVYNVCLTVCGAATFLSAFCLDFYTLAIYGIVFGFTIGAYVGLTSVILVDLLGLDKLTNAFGLLLLFQGIASFIGPPIGGELYDRLQSYDPAFYLAGVCIAASGLMLFAIPPIQRWQSARERQSSSADAAI